MPPLEALSADRADNARSPAVASARATRARAAAISTTSTRTTTITMSNHESIVTRSRGTPEASHEPFLHMYPPEGPKARSRSSSRRSTVPLDAPSQTAVQALTVAQTALRIPAQASGHHAHAGAKMRAPVTSYAANSTAATISANIAEGSVGAPSSSSSSSSWPHPPSLALDTENTSLAPPPLQRPRALALASALATSGASAWAPSWGLSPAATYSFTSSGRPGPNFGCEFLFLPPLLLVVL